MRTLFSTRKRLNDPVLKRVVNYYYITPNVQSDKEFLQSFIDLNAVSTTAAAANVAVNKISLVFINFETYVRKYSILFCKKANGNRR